MLEAMSLVLIVSPGHRTGWDGVGWRYSYMLVRPGSENEEVMVPEHLSSPFCEFPVLCGLGAMQVTGN